MIVKIAIFFQMVTKWSSYDSHMVIFFDMVIIWSYLVTKWSSNELYMDFSIWVTPHGHRNLAPIWSFLFAFLKKCQIFIIWWPVRWIDYHMTNFLSYGYHLGQKYHFKFVFFWEHIISKFQIFWRTPFQKSEIVNGHPYDSQVVHMIVKLSIWCLNGIHMVIFFHMVTKWSPNGHQEY